MLLDDDVMADGEAKSGALSGWLGREERIEQLVLHLGRNTGVVANSEKSLELRVCPPVYTVGGSIPI